MKGTKIILKKKKTRNANMLVSGIETFLKKKKKRSVNMAVHDIRIFQSIENFFLECKKQRLSEYKTFFIISSLRWSMESIEFLRKSNKFVQGGIFKKTQGFFSVWGVFVAFLSLDWKSPQVTAFSVTIFLLKKKMKSLTLKRHNSFQNKKLQKSDKQFQSEISDF